MLNLRIQSARAYDYWLQILLRLPSGTMSRKLQIIDGLIESRTLSDLRLTEGRALVATIVERDEDSLYLEFGDGTLGMVAIAELVKAIRHENVAVVEASRAVESGDGVRASGSSGSIVSAHGASAPQLAPVRKLRSVDSALEVEERAGRVEDNDVGDQHRSSRHMEPPGLEATSSSMPAADRVGPVLEEHASQNDRKMLDNRIEQIENLPVLSNPQLDEIIVSLAGRITNSDIPELVEERPAFERRPFEAVLSVGEAKQKWQNGIDCVHDQKLPNAQAHFVTLVKSYPNLWPVRINLSHVLLRLGKPLAAAAVLYPAVDRGYKAASKPFAIATCRAEVFAFQLEPFEAQGFEALSSVHHLLLTSIAVRYQRSAELAQLVPKCVDEFAASDEYKDVTLSVLATVRNRWQLEGEPTASWCQAVTRAHLDESAYVKQVQSEQEMLRDHDPVKDVQQADRFSHPTRKKSERATPAVSEPKGNGPYARALRAQGKHDWNSAIALFNEAIQVKDDEERAVRNLATLYQRLKKTELAIAEIESAMSWVRDPVPPLNILANLYQHSERHSEAIPVLQRLHKLMPSEKQPMVLQRLAYSWLKIGENAKAEKELRKVVEAEPFNAEAKKWLVELRRARQTGDSVLMVLRDLAESFSELPELALLLLEESQYDGVKAFVVDKRRFEMRDVEYLEAEAKKAGVDRPRDRARYYLSAAKILTEIDSEQREEIRDIIRRALSSFGFATVSERREWDIARAYWCESFAVTNEWGKEADNTLAKFLLSALDDRSKVVNHHGGLRNVIRELSEQNCVSKVFELTLYASLYNPAAGERALRFFYNDESARAAILACLANEKVVVPDGDLSEIEFVRLCESPRARLRDQRRELQDAIFALGQAIGSSTEYFEKAEVALRQAESQAFLGLDRVRIQAAVDVVRHARSYFQASSFAERERHADRVKNESTRLLRESEGGPTQFSRLHLYPLAMELQRVVNDEWDAYVEKTHPLLSVSLVVDDYHQDGNNVIQLQLEIQNAPDAAPASDVVLRVLPELDYYSCPQGGIRVDGSIHEGGKRYIQVPIHITERALREQGFDLLIEGTYRDRDGEAPIEPQGLAVRLHGAGSFVSIPNPFKDYAKGGPVHDRSMFKGRDELLRRLVGVLNDPTAATKCVALYGQKRTGKTSVLVHLKNELEWPTLTVLYSLGMQTVAFSVGSFLYELLTRLDREIRTKNRAGMKVPRVKVPAREAMEKLPVPMFCEALETFHEECEVAGVGPVRIVYLLDEFTYLYTMIKKREVPEGFMKSWKALLQEQYFSAVLIGQDVMPQFIDEFPNELKTTEDIRLDYLDDKYALDLIEEPIRVGGANGETRYRKTAAQDVLELTAGSPFYIQLFCSRLVEYLNENKAPVATPSDIRRVLDALVSDELRLNDFDNLLSADNHSVDRVVKSDALLMLQQIAERTEVGGCTLFEMQESLGSLPVDALLEDLERRRVLKEREGVYTVRVGLLREWLRAHPDARATDVFQDD